MGSELKPRNTSMVLGTNWDIHEWPCCITVLHEAAIEHGEFSLKKRYVPERTCKDVSKRGVFLSVQSAER